ncbi:restriction endonuclease subunit S [Candidatus Methylospira mobilis]|uniref:restriction endonuclease subunit S n=1 Tax=Candidatus Methylospira mobilis TaxID=1808979 RepID=UPI0028EFF277|nr:restriction endonuclease subunit S [Candidatus Methylospira mobilis]WNV06034.1 restriction endonuclease subunit S [Candidatus Methylospira mobilis]
MSINWVKLSNVALTSSGGTPQRGNNKYYGGSTAWIKSGELPDGEIASFEETITEEGLQFSSAKLLPTGTLLMAMYGATVGRLGILTFPAATNQAVCAIIPSTSLDQKYLFYWLLNIRKSLINASFGGAQPNISQSVIQNIAIPLPRLETQRQIASKLKSQLAEVETARKALATQQQEIVNLSHAYIRASIEQSDTSEFRLGDVLDEVKKGIGENWADYPVLGATRDGLAPAREPPGKQPQRYKPVFAGTVFYNPMRILIGSIAYVDDNDQPGITSPDYVALQGKAGKVDSRWFYYWLRSPYGVQCINSLARGAVRERMLFNRLAEGAIRLPPYREQLRVSKALAQLQPLKAAVQRQLDDLNKIPERLLALAFNPGAKE